MTRRRVLLLAAFAGWAHADSAGDAWDVLSAAASALAAGNAAAFLECFDSRMPGHEALRADVTALLREAEPRTSAELVSNEGDDKVRTITADWILTIVSKQDSVSSTTRKQRVRCRIEKQGRKWRITSFEPADFFAPAKREG
jgi:hypothetical protein